MKIKRTVCLLLISVVLFSSCAIIEQPEDLEEIHMQTGTVDSSLETGVLIDTIPLETASPVDIGKRLCDIMGFPDQSVPPKYTWVNSSGTDDVETKYDKIDIRLDYDSYYVNSIIRIYISNGNNKPFGYYPVPYVEKYNSTKDLWERLIYAPDEVYYASGWHTCFGNVTLRFNPYYMTEPLKSGEYRFIIFAGGKEFYSPKFSIIS